MLTAEILMRRILEYVLILSHACHHGVPLQDSVPLQGENSNTLEESITPAAAAHTSGTSSSLDDLASSPDQPQHPVLPSDGSPPLAPSELSQAVDGRQATCITQCLGNVYSKVKKLVLGCILVAYRNVLVPYPIGLAYDDRLQRVMQDPWRETDEVHSYIEHYFYSFLEGCIYLGGVSTFVSGFAVACIQTTFFSESNYVAQTSGFITIVAALISLIFAFIYVLRLHELKSLHEQRAWLEHANELTSTSEWHSVPLLLAAPAAWLFWALLALMIFVGAKLLDPSSILEASSWTARAAGGVLVLGLVHLGIAVPHFWLIGSLDSPGSGVGQHENQV